MIMIRSPRVIAMIGGLVLALPLLAGEPGKWQSPESEPGSETVSLQQVKQMHADGVLIVDVRSPRQYRKRHIPGAINLYLRDRFSEQNLLEHIDRDAPFVIYCNGVSCSLSYRSVEKAVAWGFTGVKYFREGILAWRRDGNPVESGG